jgi:carbon-monoxide dehydrogenase medium subunit
MKLPAFEYERPSNIEDAIRLLSDQSRTAKIIAGGQSLIPMMAFRLANPGVLVDLAGIPCLNDITIHKNGVSIGSMVRWRDIEKHPDLPTANPLISAAVNYIAHYQIRNRGTIGGSVAHADPAAEMPGIVVTCDSLIEVSGATGRRLVRAADFFLGPLTTCLAHDEIIETIHFPAWPPTRRWAFDEFSQRRGDFAFAGVALFYDGQPDGTIENAHVGVIGATSIPCRLETVEETLNGSRLDESMIALASKTASESVDPDDDIHASAAYRRALVGTLVERTLLAASRRVAIS